MVKKEPEQSHQSSSINENDIYVGTPTANTKNATSILKAPPIPTIDKTNSVQLQKMKSEKEHTVSFIEESYYHSIHESRQITEELSPTHDLQRTNTLDLNQQNISFASPMLPKLKSEERKTDHTSGDRKSRRTFLSKKSSLPSVVAPSHISDEDEEAPIVMTAAMRKYAAQRK